ncbi:MAG TPA: hypothetical protein PKI81_01135 [bacterium]|nr:hypothetical protein [bacterium]HOZ21339.1 hypothetical protein [bacterium]
MKDTTKAVVRTCFFLAGGYLLYMAFKLKPEPDEKPLLILSGLILTLSSLYAKWIGALIILVGVVLCGLEYSRLSQPGIGFNPDLGGYVYGLAAMIIGGILITVAPSKKKDKTE